MNGDKIKSFRLIFGDILLCAGPAVIIACGWNAQDAFEWWIAQLHTKAGRACPSLIEKCYEIIQGHVLAGEADDAAKIVIINQRPGAKHGPGPLQGPSSYPQALLMAADLTSFIFESLVNATDLKLRTEITTARALNIAGLYSGRSDSIGIGMLK